MEAKEIVNQRINRTGVEGLAEEIGALPGVRGGEERAHQLYFHLRLRLLKDCL